MQVQNSIVLGGGCFWCLEAYFQLFRGVLSVTPGYAGGTTDNPTYESVCNGVGNHAEVVKITYDPNIITLAKLLEIFWAIHDPTTLNRQGHDVGPQYRSAIFYSQDDDLGQITAAKDLAQSHWDSPVVTEISKLSHFYEAEAYHINYFLNNPEKAYCQVVINPKLTSIRKKFDSLMS